jgi:predicted RecA/RadA family phage recombinase
MAAEAAYRSGDPVMVAYTPTGGDVSAGEIVLVGNLTGWTCGVAHLDIANATLGALAAGGGVYDVKVASNYAAGAKVYWDNTNSVLTTTSTNMSLFGFTVEAAAAANAVVKVLHQPHV